MKIKKVRRGSKEWKAALDLGFTPIGSGDHQTEENARRFAVKNPDLCEMRRDETGYWLMLPLGAYQLG